MAALFAVVASACACAAGAQPSFAMPVALAPATPPISSPTPTSVDFGSVQMGMSSDPVTVTLLNSGGGSLSFWRFGIASSSANPRDFSVVPGGTCTTAAALGSAESCTVLVRFKPTTSGVRSGLLSFWDNTAGGRTNVALGGSATPPPVSSASPTSVDFGSAQLGTSSDLATVTLTNAGAGALSFWRFGIASSSANPSDFSVGAGGTCAIAAALASGESCTVLVRFRPTAMGARSGLLSFWDNTLAGRINVALSGTALPASESSVSPVNVDFGPVQVGSSSDPATVTVTNTGVGTLSFWRFGIASSSANPSDFFVVAGGTCSLSLTLASGETCTVFVRFRPTAPGARSGLLSFWDNTLAGRVNAGLSGTALPGAESTLSPAAIDFGAFSIGESSSPATATITNTGSGSLSFWRIGIASSSLNASDFAVVSGGTCILASTLANGESCTVLVRFRPTAGGVRSALLSFWDNTLVGRVNVALTGIGNDPCGAGCF